MKNVEGKSRGLIKTIAMTVDDFAELVDTITEGNQFVVDNEEGVHIELTLEDKPFKNDRLTTKLSEYFGVQVTSWHSDNFEIPLVYICYEETTEKTTNWELAKEEIYKNYKRFKENHSGSLSKTQLEEMAVVRTVRDITSKNYNLLESIEWLTQLG